MLLPPSVQAGPACISCASAEEVSPRLVGLRLIGGHNPRVASGARHCAGASEFCEQCVHLEYVRAAHGGELELDSCEFLVGLPTAECHSRGISEEGVSSAGPDEFSRSAYGCVPCKCGLGLAW